MGGSSSPPTCHLFVLNDDVIRDIFDFLRQEREHWAFSMTCKHIRQTCNPIFFRRVRIATEWDVMSGRIFRTRSDIWLYVKYLTFCGSWLNSADGNRNELGELQRPLRDLLNAMPLLHTICFTGGWNGVPWDAFKTSLSVAQLRNFLLYMTPERKCRYPVESEPFSVAPLETFGFIFDRARSPGPYVGELSLFDFVIPQLSNSLVTLKLPLESAPLAKLASSQWPRLENLHLWGDRRLGSNPSVPMIAVISAMPKLRSFRFLSAQKDDQRRENIWPDGSPWSITCFELESVEISYPDPQDRLFAHLPPTLRRFVLRCWPRHYLHQYDHERRVMDRNGWKSPIPTAAEMLMILERRPSQVLEELEIEYMEDDCDDALLRALAVLFPSLKALTLLRYRRQGNTHVSVDRIAQNLSTLAHLCILRIHLDLPSALHPYAPYKRTTEWNPDQFRAYVRHCEDAIQVLANNLTASLRYVCILSRLRSSNKWHPFQVIRDDPRTIHVKEDPRIETLFRLSMHDENGPPLDD